MSERAASDAGDDVHGRRIAEILDGFGEAFIAFDFEWRIVHCNRAAEAHFGFRREAVLGQVIWDRVPGIGGTLYTFLQDVMATRQSRDTELPSDLRPGAWLAMRAFPLETGIGTSFRDITERRERLRGEREQAARLELALAASGFGDWSWDAATDVVDFSSRAAEMWGIPPGPEMTWTQMQDLLHPDDRERARLAVEAAVATHTNYEIEYRVFRPIDGELRWVMVRAHGTYAADGTPTGMLGVLADITRVKAEEERVLAERERLADLESRHSFLLELADTLVGLDDPEAIISTSARMIGERLGADRTAYAEIDESGARILVTQDWQRQDPGPRASARFDLASFGPAVVEILEAGRILRIDEVAADPRAAPFAPAYAALGMGAVLSAPMVRNGRLEALLNLATFAPRAWTDQDAALVQDVAARTWASLERARFERALRESEARFRAMADSAPAPIWLTSVTGAMEFVNRAFAEIVGAPQEALHGDAWVAFMHAEDRPTVAALRDAGRRDLKGYRFTARFRRHDGQWRWMHASSQPRFDAAGEFQGYVGIATDVTDQRRADERQRLLINELNHRVKNTLATIQSMAHQTLREGVVTKEARGRLTDRLLALSAAHNVLTQENWEGADIREIAAQAIAPYDDAQSRRIEIGGPAVRVIPSVALALSLGLHELATNAVKHGALSVPAGRVNLSWVRTDGHILLEWRERGGPPADAPGARGFGSRLLGQGLAAELGAPAELSFEPEGLVCRVKAPVA